MVPGKVLCKNHACTFAEREREREVYVTFLKNFSKLIVIKHSKLGPKYERKKHNSVI